MKEQQKETIIKGVAVLMLSQIFIKITGLAYKLYLTNKSGFGDIGNAIYSSGFQIYALLLTFSSTGVPNAISKLISERLAINDYKGANKVFKISLVIFAILGGLGSIFLFLCAGIISEKWIQIPEAKVSLICLAPSIFFVSLSSVMRGYFNGIEKFSTTAKTQFAEQLFKTIFTIVLVELSILVVGKNTKIMAGAANLATTLATICSFVHIFIYYRMKKINKKVSENYKPLRIRETFKKIVGVAFPISISSLIASFNKNIDSFTVVRFLKIYMNEEKAKTQYGILSGKVDILCALPFSLNIAFTTTIVPSISKYMVKGEIKQIKRKKAITTL